MPKNIRETFEIGDWTKFDDTAAKYINVTERNVHLFEDDPFAQLSGLVKIKGEEIKKAENYLQELMQCCTTPKFQHSFS